MAASRPRTTTPIPARPDATFRDLGLPEPLVDVLATQGITQPFPIQSATLPDSLAGRDVLGRGRTGSGKTYAFLLPMLTRLAASPSTRRPRRPRALILAPTRELVSQIEASLAPLARALSLRTLTVFGGVRPNPQIQGLRNGVDIVIACPGRLADHVQSGHADLDAVEITVLDEADHMADLGFLPVVRRLLDATPRDGQRLLFSATLDGGVDVLVKRFLTDPVVHSVDSAQSPVATMSHHVLHLDKEARVAVLADLAAAPGRTVVFTRTKHGAKALARQLNSRGVPTVELHGIHVDDVSLVVHADPPVEHKAYLHRSGRTARAGAAGTVVTLMLDAQVSDVRDLTRKAGVKPTITRVTVGHPLLAEIAPGDRSFVQDRTSSTPTSGAREGRSGKPSRRRRASGRSRSDGSQTPGATTSRGDVRRTPARASGAPRSTSRTHSAASFSSGARGR
jgi:superfamily II DNA/RNA helicase